MGRIGGDENHSRWIVTEFLKPNIHLLKLYLLFIYEKYRAKSQCLASEPKEEIVPWL